MTMDWASSSHHLSCSPVHTADYPSCLPLTDNPTGASWVEVKRGHVGLPCRHPAAILMMTQRCPPTAGPSAVKSSLVKVIVMAFVALLTKTQEMMRLKVQNYSASKASLLRLQIAEYTLCPAVCTPGPYCFLLYSNSGEIEGTMIVGLHKIYKRDENIHTSSHHLSCSPVHTADYPSCLPLTDNPTGASWVEVKRALLVPHHLIANHDWKRARQKGLLAAPRPKRKRQLCVNYSHALLNCKPTASRDVTRSRLSVGCASRSRRDQTLIITPATETSISAAGGKTFVSIASTSTTAETNSYERTEATTRACLQLFAIGKPRNWVGAVPGAESAFNSCSLLYIVAWESQFLFYVNDNRSSWITTALCN
uniref:Uncharacterized protein n=1 Tax=Branchiostoma floridae TaxID=7739 RepID=C3XTU1_BRAFL|eukprot:XP_002612306.1 hypothetical protein BRAFLDRAFT_80079 [Branchiostoma floridae]